MRINEVTHVSCLAQYLAHTEGSVGFSGYCSHKSAFQIPAATSHWAAASAPDLGGAMISSSHVDRIGCTHVSLRSLLLLSPLSFLPLPCAECGRAHLNPSGKADGKVMPLSL